MARSFDRITVDGDTSTNDTCLMLANGRAGAPPLEPDTEPYRRFAQALEHVCIRMVRAVAADGEGATRLVTVTVTGAAREDDAVRLARSVAGSSLVKAALCGADANWGRVLCAMGYAGVPFEPSRVSVRFSSSVGELLVCQGGVGVPFAEGVAETILDREEVTIRIDLGAGDQEATCWGCDLTPDYVRK